MYILNPNCKYFCLSKTKNPLDKNHTREYNVKNVKRSHGGWKMTSVYFIRHAQSERHFHDDRLRPLTETGHKDAQMISSVLADRKADFIVSSPYQRCIDTVKPLALAKGLEILTDEDFRERAAGKWHGDRFFDFIKKQWEDHYYRIEGGESLSEVRQRNIRALNKVIGAHSGEKGIVVTHGTALSTILNHYYPEYDYECFLKIADLMPLVIRLDFEGYECTEAQVELAVRRKYNDGELS